MKDPDPEEYFRPLCRNATASESEIGNHRQGEAPSVGRGIGRRPHSEQGLKSPPGEPQSLGVDQQEGLSH